MPEVTSKRKKTMTTSKAPSADETTISLLEERIARSFVEMVWAAPEQEVTLRSAIESDRRLIAALK